MSYDPQYLSNLIPPIVTKVAGGSAWQRCRDNHNQLFRYYEPTVAQWAGDVVFTNTGADVDLLRFRSRNGEDYIVAGKGLQLRVTLMARRVGLSGLPSVLSLKGGAAVVSSNVTAASFTSVTLTADPVNTDEEWTVSGLAAAGDQLEVCSLVAHWISTTPGTRAYLSGYRQAESGWDKDDAAVSTELAARLLNGPIAIAKDRPSCVFSHLWRVNVTGASFVKSDDVDFSAWGAEETGTRVVVGVGRVPCADIRARSYVVQYFLRSSHASTGQIRVGGAVFTTTANAWQTFQIELSPVDVDIVATIDTQGVGEWAYYETLQVFRQAT